jgi:hypothetical protein
VKTKQNEVKLFKILQDQSKTNVFVSNCVEEEKRKNEASFFLEKKAKKNKYNRSSTIEDLPLLIAITFSITIIPFFSMKLYSGVTFMDRFRPKEGSRLALIF